MNNTQALKKWLLPNVYLKRSANRHPYYIKLLYFCSAAKVLALKCNKATSLNLCLNYRVLTMQIEVSEKRELCQQSTEKVLDSLDFCFRRFSHQLLSSALVRFGNSFQIKCFMEICPQLLSLHLSWLCKILRTYHQGLIKQSSARDGTVCQGGTTSPKRCSSIYSRTLKLSSSE